MQQSVTLFNTMGEQKAKPVFGVPGPKELSPLAIDLIAARRRLRMAVRDFARDRLEISEDALRDIEAGRTKQPRRETLLRILTWARRRGYQQFGGYVLTKGDADLDASLRMDADALPSASASFRVGTF
jgi:DNA-binding transcriptional regulator YiaG